ncbi:hypothetical protein FOA52_010795 [Chlamydomonas sp. UWO 241]|nr:hypothetical protein FOA52_010795 [Chlamydomonas sp. UWO 241]
MPKEKKEKKEKVPSERPPSAWLLFCNDEREKVKEEGFTGTNTLVELGRRWKVLPDSERQKWLDMAKPKQDEYHQKHPTNSRPRKQAAA